MRSLMRALLATAALLLALSACGGGASTTPDAFDVLPDAPPGDATDVVEASDLATDLATDLGKDDDACPGECCDASDCDDHDLCTVDRCDEHACVHPPQSCDDGNACTTDSCDPATGCRHESVTGCCLEGSVDTLYAADFVEGLGDVSTEILAGSSAPLPAQWQPSEQRYHSAPRSLYFGDAAAGTYANGLRVSARFETPRVAVPGNRRAQLSFWVWLDVAPEADVDRFAVSALVGAARVPVYHKQAELVDRTWHQVTVDLTAFAGGDVGLEFAFDSVVPGSDDRHGLYVDDIALTSVCSTPTCGEVTDCDDAVACTGQTCNGGACACTADDACCVDALDCRDGDACTADLCDGGVCRWEAVPEAGCCNADADCSDVDACTADTCVEGTCKHLPSGATGCCWSNADCDDGDPCTRDTCFQGGCMLVNTCCLTDADCDDGDDVCTDDFCIDAACISRPTGIPGCCQPDVLALSFDDGTLGPVTVKNASDKVGWRVAGGTPDSPASTPALYYGNGDPEHPSYDDGSANWGEATVPVTLVPEGSALALTFDAWLDVEATPDFDALTLALVIDGATYRVWDKTTLAGTSEWHTYTVDLSAFSGRTGFLVARFDTVDDTSNQGQGVYLDNVTVTSSCAARACVSDADCDDGVAATQARCLPNGQCGYTLQSEPCAYAFQCNDDDPCTTDTCSAGFCEHLDVPACCRLDADCDDGNACTADTCDAGNACHHAWTPGCCRVAADCDDADPCTADTCPEPGGACLHAATEGCCALNRDCDDGLAITDDACTPGGCVHRPVACVITPDCADDDPCTDDACVDGTCTWLPVASASCCQPVVFEATFDDATAGPFSLLSSAYDVRWRVSDVRSNSTPYALHYGDPAVGTYADDGATSGRVISTPIFLPPNAGLSLSFATWLDVETALDRDTLNVVLHTDLGPVVVWTKADWTGPVRAWTTQQADLGPYAGQAVQLEFVFDTVDSQGNAGEGVYLDDVRVTSGCAPLPCLSDADCASFDACAPARCTDGLCLSLPTPGCCAADVECDDGNACTTDTCPAAGGGCAHAWKPVCCLSVADCDDANPCTDDGCTGPGGICTHDAVEGCCLTNGDCDDHVGTTLDVCLDAACLHRPATCLTEADCDDGDACTSARCLQGACAYLPVTEPECCAPTLLSASFDQGTALPFALSPDGWHLATARYGESAPASLHFGVESGATGCDDGFDVTTHDTWTGDGCHGLVAEPPAIFRVDTLAIDEPTLLLDAGAGPVPVNELVGAWLTARLADFQHGGLVAAFDPLAFGFPETRLVFGEGDCTFDGAAPIACGFLVEGRQARFDGVTLAADGGCGEGAPEAPCFATPSATFTLSDVVPGLFPAGLDTTVTGRVTGGLQGTPVAGLQATTVRAFVPAAMLDAVQIELPAPLGATTAADLLDPAALTHEGGHDGWWLQLSLSATRVPFAASGCTALPDACDDHDPCTLDRCDVIRGECFHRAAVDGAACDDGEPLTIGDACRLGACVGVAPAAAGTCGDDPEACDDLDPGTLDLCAADTGACVHPTQPSLPPAGSYASLLPRSGKATSTPVALPPSAETHLSFSLFADVEAGASRDPLLVRVLGADGPHVVWDKQQLGAADYRRWVRQQVDLSGFQGQTVRLQFDFDTVDTLANDGEGVYLDDVRVTTTCAPPACTDASDCGTPAPCRTAACVDGACLEAAVPECCLATADCDDQDLCTTDACVQGTCSHARQSGCCTLDAQCDDGQPCTADTCTTGHACKHSFDPECTTPLPYLQPFTGVSALSAIGWTAQNQSGGPGTNFKVTGASAPFDDHLMFDDTPVVQNYVHRAMSPRLSAPQGVDVSLKWRASYDAYSAATTDTTCSVEVSADDGATWTEAWAATYKKVSAAAETHVVDVSAVAAGSDQVRLAFVVTGKTSYDLLGWHIDDVGALTGKAPVVDEIGPVTAEVGTTTELLFHATDPEGQPVTATLEVPTADWLHLEDRTDGLFALVAEPTIDEVGQHPVTLRVSDGQFDVTRELVLTVASNRILLAETFDSASTLAELGWTALQGTGSVSHWSLATTGAIDGSHAASFGWSPTVSTFAETLQSPSFDASATEGEPVQLVFTHRLDLTGAFQGTLAAKVSADDGATWSDAWSLAVDDALDVGPTTLVLPIGDLLQHSATARVAFTLSGKSTSPLASWQIDTVRVLRGAPPTITPVPPQTAYVGKARDLVVHASDPDGDALTFSLDAPLSFVQLTALGPNAAVIHVVPTAADWGEHVVGLRVTDGLFTAHTTIPLTVANEGESLLLHETFDDLAALADHGWTILLGANPNLNKHWRLVATSPISDSAAAEFYWSPGVYDYDESLVSPPIDASALTGQAVTLGFSHVLDVYSATTIVLSVGVSIDGGQTFETAWSQSVNASDAVSDIGPESVQVDLTPWLAGAADARVAFRIEGDNSYSLNGWYVDDVLLLGLTEP